MGVLSDLSLWLWRLLPANPILVRVVTMGGKRTRHMAARAAYLGALVCVLLLFGTATLGQSGSLVELAKRSSNAFMWVSVAQLLMVCFIAPVFTAAAITQEKDANTFHILLTTPLSAGQIVLGSLFSRLYFVWVLLLSGLPVFCITMIYGGVTATEVFLSLALASCTALVTGALAISLSVTRVGTRRTIFSFFAGVAAYLIGVWVVGLSSWGQLAEAPPGVALTGSTPLRMSWLAPVHPFLALMVVTAQTPAPVPPDVHAYGWPWRWMLAYPQYAYLVLTTLASVVLICYSLLFVRRGAKEGEGGWAARVAAVFRTEEERRRRPRVVWHNPIAWREAATRASAGGRSILRWVFIAGGALAGLYLLIAAEKGWWGLTPSGARGALTTLVWIELGVILLVVTNAAATTLTREKESMTIELLLATPLTSEYIVRGMLRGLLSFALPMIAVPMSTLLLFLLADVFRQDWAASLGWLQAALSVPLLLVAYTSVAAIIGLQCSLHSRKTVQAVMSSAAVVITLTAILSGCGAGLIGVNPHAGALFAPLAPLPACRALIQPEALYPARTAAPASGVAELRVVILFSTMIAAAAYLTITYMQYRGIVRSFDMVVRRQAA
jgi:ABC-type transport system involved in multi-copper enzyme maturation permease subunit